MRSWKLAAAPLVLACHAAAQGVAPDVMLLARIQSHMREELSNLPNYTCLETIVRFQGGSRRELRPLDTVRLEVFYSDHREWYGAPGSRNLSKDNPRQLIGRGMIGTGEFAIALGNILGGVATITSRGEEALGGRTVLKYDFHLPRFLDRFEISLPGGTGTVGEEGSFWADPHSLDFVRLESHADEIPSDLPLRAAGAKVDYARTRIGGRDVLVPQQAELHIVRSTGQESFNRLEFTHCRAFSAQSAVSFDSESQEPGKPLPPNAPAFAPARPSQDPSQAPSQVPDRLLITLQLTTPITEHDVVGTPIEARTVGDVRRKGKIVIPDGAVVRGRIRRLERADANGRPAFLVALEFTNVEASAGPLPFYADLLRVDRGPGIRPVLSERVTLPCGAGEGCQSGDLTFTVPELPGVASWSVSGITFTVPRGFRMAWRTRGISETTAAPATLPVLPGLSRRP
jgi:hypothetical protein